MIKKTQDRIREELNMEKILIKIRKLTVFQKIILNKLNIPSVYDLFSKPKSNSLRAKLAKAKKKKSGRQKSSKNEK